MSESQLDLLRRHGVRPVKRRGQNFLVDGNLARAIADHVLALGREVVELGAGGGALTTHLLDRGARVVAVEVDRRLCAVLQDEFGTHAGFALCEDDLARLDWEAVLAAAGERPVMAGNLPYVLTSKVLFALADLRARVAGGVFMVQREVADRLVAAPGSRDYGVLAVVMGSLFTIDVLRTVPATVFWPQPEVTSAVVRLVPTDHWPADEYAVFLSTVKLFFQQRRKQVGSLLRRLPTLDEDAVARRGGGRGGRPRCTTRADRAGRLAPAGPRARGPGRSVMTRDDGRAARMTREGER